MVQLGLQPVNCVSRLQYLIPIATSSATAHTGKCLQQAVGEAVVLSPKESGSRAKELLRSAGAGARNLPRGSISLQSLAAGPEHRVGSGEPMPGGSYGWSALSSAFREA